MTSGWRSPRRDDRFVQLLLRRLQLWWRHRTTFSPAAIISQSLDCVTTPKAPSPLSEKAASGLLYMAKSKMARPRRCSTAATGSE